MAVAIEIIAIIKRPIDMTNILLTAALLLTAKLSAFAGLDLGSTASRTPYDPYLAPVRQTFASMNGESATMQKVQAWMREGRGFRYSHTVPYYPALPQETAAKRQGDCKDKALWMINNLQDPTARFVIGQDKRGAAMSHAWVMWQNQGKWWILDCTLNSQPIPADRVGPNEYVPQYSYTKGASFTHNGLPTTDMVAKVAARKQAPVASAKKTGRTPLLAAN